MDLQGDRRAGVPTGTSGSAASSPERQTTGEQGDRVVLPNTWKQDLVNIESARVVNA